MQIVFVASEAVPFVKTGGLADVVGALPQQPFGPISRVGRPTRHGPSPSRFRMEIASLESWKEGFAMA
jgi:starch synthase